MGTRFRELFLFQLASLLPPQKEMVAATTIPARESDGLIHFSGINHQAYEDSILEKLRKNSILFGNLMFTSGILRSCLDCNITDRETSMGVNKTPTVTREEMKNVAAKDVI
uniref:Uncharacterized protein n=1 Tax=Salix viminalis TaxID=40686 RepID=A0A6N2MY52_SALVM